MRLNRENLLAHIEEEDKILEMKKIIDKIEIVFDNYNVLSTDFMDPYEVYLAKSILNRFMEISYKVSGGYEGAERSIIYIFPEYLYDVEDEDLSYLKIECPNKLEHPDILGSLIGLGIDRRKLGDIVVNENESFIIVKSEISDFIEFGLKKIGRNNIKVKKVEEISVEKEEYDIKTLIVSSLRIDTVISATLRLSRSLAANLVNADKVKVNFKEINKSAYLLEKEDMISVRGYGRFIFSEIEGITKKDKYIVKIKIPK